MMPPRGFGDPRARAPQSPSFPERSGMTSSLPPARAPVRAFRPARLAFLCFLHFPAFAPCKRAPESRIMRSAPFSPTMQGRTMNRKLRKQMLMAAAILVGFVLVMVILNEVLG